MSDIVIVPTDVKDYPGQGSNLSPFVGRYAGPGSTAFQGSPVYKGDDGQFYLASCYELASSQVIGFLTSSATIGQDVSIMPGGLPGQITTQFSEIDFGCDLQVGMEYVLSRAGGGVMPITDLARGDVVVPLGIAAEVRRLQININPTGIRWQDGISTPTDLGAVAWLRNEDNLVYTNTGGTTPANVGDRIALWITPGDTPTAPTSVYASQGTFRMYRQQTPASFNFTAPPPSISGTFLTFSTALQGGITIGGHPHPVVVIAVVRRTAANKELRILGHSTPGTSKSGIWIGADNTFNFLSADGTALFTTPYTGYIGDDLFIVTLRISSSTDHVTFYATGMSSAVDLGAMLPANSVFNIIGRTYDPVALGLLDTSQDCGVADIQFYDYDMLDNDFYGMVGSGGYIDAGSVGGLYTPYGLSLPALT